MSTAKELEEQAKGILIRTFLRRGPAGRKILRARFRDVPEILALYDEVESQEKLGEDAGKDLLADIEAELANPQCLPIKWKPGHEPEKGKR